MNAVINGELVELSKEETDAHLAHLSEIANAEREHSIFAQIRELESTVTNRRLREAALTEAGKARLADVDDQITALRAQRV